jgi:hypothetical protein
MFKLQRTFSTSDDLGSDTYKHSRTKRPRKLLDLEKQLLIEDPDISEDDFVISVQEEATPKMKDEAVASHARSAFKDLRKPKKPEPTPEEKAAKAKASKEEAEAKAAEYKAEALDRVLAKLIMPNGKPMSECTNGEMIRFFEEKIRSGSDKMTAGSGEIAFGKRGAKFFRENGGENDNVGELTSDQYQKLGLTVEDLRSGFAA